MTDRLTEIRARLAAATPGSWTYSRAAHFDETRAWPPHEVLGEPKRAGGTTSQLVIAGCSEPADAALIAAAPADLEWACAEIERLKRALASRIDLHDADGRALLVAHREIERLTREWDEARAIIKRNNAEAMGLGAARDELEDCIDIIDDLLVEDGTRPLKPVRE